MGKVALGSVLLVVLAVCACGLPDQYFIAAPNIYTQPGGSGNTFSFSNPDHSYDSLTLTFQGFELYYKFFSTDDTTVTTGGGYSSTSTSDVQTQLLNAGYLPLCASTDIPLARSAPLLSVATLDINTTFNVTVTINQYPASSISTASYAVASTGDQVSVEIRRDVADSVVLSTGYKLFLQNTYSGSDPSFLSTDADIKDIWTKFSNAGVAYLAMYAVSYGLQGISTPVRSTPLFLGYITVYM